MKAILFVGHGSKDAEGNEEIRNFVNSVSPELEVPIIETCFLEFEQPTVIQGLETCVKRGAHEVAIIPMMLFAAGHAKIHIPAAIDEMKERYPHVQFTYGRPIGIHEEVLSILASRMQESGMNMAQPDPDMAVLLVGRGSSDPDANSDLFKMSRLFWERGKIKWVETAFMGVTAPLVNDGVERCIRLGAKRIVVLPYFLFTGVLIKRMEGMVQRYTEQYPDIQFTLAHYFGFHPQLKEVFKDRVVEALGGEVKMNCDTCQYRLAAMKDMDHHHHHDHDHGHGHHHHDHDHGHGHHHHHDHHHDHDHVHHHDCDHITTPK